MADTHSDLPAFNHPAPVKLLVGVFVALVVLTILTLVFATIDLGVLNPFRFLIAMLIATAKAALVMLFFMHMAWDKPFNVLVFLSSMLFVSLFIGLTLLDTSEYQEQIDQFPREAETVQAP